MKKAAFKETKIHGRLDFPFAVYRGDMPYWLRVFPLHWHKEFEIIYAEEGNGLVSVDGKNYRVFAGDMILVAPDSIHEIRQFKNEKFVYYNILFKFSLLEEDEQNLLYKKYFYPFEEGSLQAPVYLPSSDASNRKIFENIKYFVENWQDEFSDKLLEVKASIFAVVKEIFDISVKVDASKINDSTFSRMKPLLSYLQDNYSKAISIKEAAELCNYSESFFMKVFKARTGFTFTDYLNNYRLEKAEEILKQTDCNLSETAAMCGFESLSYFIKRFRQKFGITPHKFAARVKEQSLKE